MIKVIIAGAKGRMGQSLLRCAETIPAIIISGQIDLGDDLSRIVSDADVLIDFTSHGSTAGFAGICATHKKAMVIGTTGHTEAEENELRTFAAQVPMVWASNFSTGVNVLFWLARKTAAILGSDYDLEIVEMHHRLKKDAPSGTAKTLAQILAAARHENPNSSLRYGREGLVGKRTAGEIGIHSIRGGDVVGDHTVIFAAPGERVELTHKASNREAFAAGAFRAAQWVLDKKPGIYDMMDVLGLNV